MNIKLKTFPGTEELIFQTLEKFRQIFPMLGKNDGIMLAGGRTPLEIYRRAAVEGLSTAGQLFLSDERYVPVTDPQSNYGGIAPFFASCPPHRLVGQASLYSESLCLSHTQKSTRSRLREACPTPNGQNFIRVQTELPIESAAQAFDETLSRIQSVPFGLLGLGADGHTASLFNLQDAALRDERLAVAVGVEEASSLFLQRQDAAATFTSKRISVTPTLLHKVEKILILATGADKKAMIQTLLEKPETIPSGVALAGHPHVEIWTDQPVYSI
jgi:6-phosphogluconolactonase/glucosamine-6-phosphate isomerase/deaminase